VKKLVVPLAIIAMLALLGAAVAWDCVRLAADARNRVALADAEMQKHEERLVKLLAALPKATPEMQSAVTAYKEATTPEARREAYDRLVAAFRNAPNAVDPTNPIDRKFMDDVAGAINRREVAQKPHDAEVADYHAFLNSSRGRIARFFSAQANTDWSNGQ
jgi:hypothetical protein